MQRHQYGVTLIELMITVALSMIVILGAFNFFISSREMSNLQDASLRVQENARYALDELTRALRMAGYYNLMTPGAVVPSGSFYFGECGEQEFCTRAGYSAATHYSDWVGIMLNPPQDDGTDHDCAGYPVSGSATTVARAVMVYRYGVTPVNGLNTLVCETFLLDAFGVAHSVNDSPYELVAGVDILQMLYGLAADSRSDQIVQYVGPAILQQKMKDGKSMPAVLSVRIGLLASSGYEDRSLLSKEQSYTVLNAAPVAYNDGNIRSVHTTTVLLNNSRM